ncbi:YceI family protein [Flavobacteriaceae bacterium]|nr:YceI family protein [Flavobacteriaceae bacterium]
MKKLIVAALVLLTLSSCKDTKENKTTSAPASTYQLSTDTASVNWIGYKFTDKAGVKGQFKSITIKNANSAASINEALQGVSFSIPVSSLFTNNDVRDNKLKSIFFGVMKNTELLEGTVKTVTDNGGLIALTMNGETHDLPFTTQKQNNTLYLGSELDLKTWNAQEALASIHKACEILHTGADGVSKTWDTVTIDVTLNFIKG